MLTTRLRKSQIKNTISQELFYAVYQAVDPVLIVLMVLPVFRGTPSPRGSLLHGS